MSLGIVIVRVYKDFYFSLNAITEDVRTRATVLRLCSFPQKPTSCR